MVPQSVYEDICVRGYGLIGAKELARGVKDEFIRVVKPADQKGSFSLSCP